MSRKILVTSALTYANGSLHLGHILEYVQTDIWHRFQKLCGHQSIYVGGEDAHGTAIMLRAEKEKISPAALISNMHNEHQQDLGDFLIDYDNYHTTHSPENRQLVVDIYEKLKARGDIQVKKIRQAFDTKKQLFLADRFIKGECPRCGTADQYGDHCENCGATYRPTHLKNPYSVLSGSIPIEKTTEHYFFALSRYANFLRKWAKTGPLQPEVQHKLDEWFTTGLRDWDISRDAPYFGFAIPNASDKYFYVWLDAPIGYMASLQNLVSQRDDLHFDEFWQEQSHVELHHFIGKDITYFHALFWPAILHGAGYRKPTAIHTHGFLTIDGQKMSKSRGTFIKARTYIKHLSAEYLRYYYASKLSSKLEDIDLHWQDFRLRVNADLIGKYINIASRCAGFINKKFANQLASTLTASELYAKFRTAGEKIATHYEQQDFNRAIREIMLLADQANQYIAQQQPWVLARDKERLAEVQKICTAGINLFYLLTIYLKPVLPQLTAKIEDFLNISPLMWQDTQQPLLNHTIKEFKPLLQRIEVEQITALQASAKNDVIA